MTNLQHSGTNGTSAAPPPHLAPTAKAAWDAIAPRLRAAELLTDLDETALAVLCGQYARYRKALEQARASSDPYKRVLFREIAEPARVKAREWAAAFLLIPEEHIPLGPLNEDGMDVELLRFFDPDGGPLVPVERPVSPAEYAARRR